MKSISKVMALVILAVGLPFLSGPALAVDNDAGAALGKALFEQHCAVCHPNGGNIINPAKPLDKESLAANGIKSPADIVAIMRNPGPGMTPFGTGIIPDKAAMQLAEYILKTY